MDYVPGCEAVFASCLGDAADLHAVGSALPARRASEHLRGVVGGDEQFELPRQEKLAEAGEHRAVALARGEVGLGAVHPARRLNAPGDGGNGQNRDAGCERLLHGSVLTSRGCEAPPGGR